MSRRFLLILILMLFAAPFSFAQLNNTGFNYQAVFYNADSGAYMVNTQLWLRFTFFNTNNQAEIYYQEEHNTSTGDRAVFSVLVGQGTPTTGGSLNAFEDLDFGLSEMSLSVEIDIDGGGYSSWEEGRLWAVPYAYFAADTDPPGVIEMLDVDIAGLSTNMMLQWDGMQWVPIYIVQALYADTILGNSVYADTVNWAETALSINDDTALVALYTDSIAYSTVAGYVASVDTAVYADTADFAYSAYVWNVNGNSDVNAQSALGSINTQPLIFTTNGTERFRLTETGQFHSGTTGTTPSFHLNSFHEGFRAASTFGTGSQYDVGGANPKLYWSGKRSSFYGGAMTDTLWNENSSSQYSFAYGRNCWVGPFASEGMAIGDSSYVNTIPANGSLSNGLQGMAIGYHSRAAGAYSLAVGYECEALISRSVAMGYQAKAPNGYASVAIGYNVNAYGNNNPSVAIGSNLHARGPFSVCLGNLARYQHFGGFCYGDMSTNDTLWSTGNYQFRVRAAGGADFYSSSGLTSGVLLASGGGAWMTVSDASKKENVRLEQPDPFKQNLLGIQLYSWNYKTQPSVLHVGPTAQSMYKLFGFGESNRTITTTDIDGVVMYGVLLLHRDYKLVLEEHENAKEQAEESAELDYSDLDSRIKLLEEQLESLNSQE